MALVALCLLVFYERRLTCFWCLVQGLAGMLATEIWGGSSLSGASLFKVVSGGQWLAGPGKSPSEGGRNSEGVFLWKKCICSKYIEPPFSPSIREMASSLLQLRCTREIFIYSFFSGPNICPPTDCPSSQPAHSSSIFHTNLSKENIIHLRG